LLLDEHGFGHDGVRTAETGESGDRRQQVRKKRRVGRARRNWIPRLLGQEGCWQVGHANYLERTSDFVEGYGADRPRCGRSAVRIEVRYPLL